jgi:hypothetical protein
MIITHRRNAIPIPKPENLLGFYMTGGQSVSGGTATWLDTSGNGLDMTQSTLSRLPSVESVNGFDSFSFVNAALADDDFIDSGNNGLVNGKSGATTFAVIRFDAAQTVDGGIFGFYTGTPSFVTGGMITMAAISGSLYPRYQYRRSVGDSTLSVTSSTAMSDGDLYAIVARVDFTNGSQLLDISVNQSVTTGTAPTGATYTFDTGKNRKTLAGAAVISAATLPTAACTVKILECGIYDYSITDGERSQLNQYLASKFGIS